jgi:hypothetical protein
VTGWVGQDGRTLVQRYREMATESLRGVSPGYERLCLGVADDPALLDRLATLPPAKQQPNLLLAATRYLDGPIDAYPEFAAWALERWDDLAAVMLARATQTNEAARCTALLPALAAIDGPVALFEVGASAGLCLYPDRYAYRYRFADGERRVGDGPLVLDCAARGPVPVPGRLPDVVWRGGLDLNPLDVTDPDVARWLECLVWPEERHRFGVLRAALAVARDDPPHVVAGDLTTDLAAAVAAVPADATLVVQHSAVLPYVDEAGRAAFRAAVAAVAAIRPTVWLANEVPGVVDPADTVRRDGVRFLLSVDGRPVALTGSHGDELEWLG